MKSPAAKYIILLVAIFSFHSVALSASLIVPDGNSYNLPPGDLQFDFVDIQGTVILTGNANIVCTGNDGFFNLSSTGIIISTTATGNDPNNGKSGANGANGAPDGGNGQNGTQGGSYTAPDGTDSFTLTITADNDITLYGTIDLSASPGYNHTGFGGPGGSGGHGADGTTSGQSGGNGGHAGSVGGSSIGGNGGDAGNLTLISTVGIVDCSSLSVDLSGGKGGNASTAGKGGNGGNGGDGFSGCGNGGNGGNGGIGGKGAYSIAGNGGKGGSMSITAGLGIIIDTLNLTQTGGSPGTPGTPGAGGSGGLRGYAGRALCGFGVDGSNGYPGSNGLPGKQIQGSPGATGTYTEGYTGCLAKINAGHGVIADLNKDCYVNINDFAVFASYWLYCMDPNDPACDQPWL